jgi:hypothetical protein
MEVSSVISLYLMPTQRSGWWLMVRPARATIQFPDQRESVASRTSQAEKRTKAAL